MGRKYPVPICIRPFALVNSNLLDESFDSFRGSQNSYDGFIHTFEAEEIEPFKDVVREIIESGYRKIGGTRVPLDRVFADPQSMYRIFSLSPDENEKNKFCAVAIYKVEKSPRLRYIAGRGQFRAKGVYALVEYELKQNEYCFFAEVSGAIEHICAKSGGYIVPNIFVPKLLGISNKNMLQLVPDDLFHYKHDFGDGVKRTKVLYGFKNKKT